MSPRLAWILVASLALPALSLAQAAAAEEVVTIFAKDAGGRITYHIYRELGATDRIVKKIE